MSTKKIITRNVLWNCSGLAARMLVGFFIAPFLLHRLGASTYGLWIVIASLTSYFGVLDLGVRGSVGRNVALFRARGDLAGLNGIFSTAFFYLCAVAALSLVVTIGALYFFFWVVQVEPDQVQTARLALLLVGLSFALSLPLQAFDGILWAYQRFDLQNGIDIPTVLLRAGLTCYVVGAGHGLVGLAAITLLTSLAGLAVKSLLALRLEPDLRIGWTHVDRASSKGLFGYGVWYFMLSLVRTIAPPVNLLIVGSRLGIALVAPFNVVTGLIGYANQFLIAGTQVLTPLATALHARDDQERQRTLFIAGGRGCLALTLLLVSLFVFLGRPLIRLWMGPTMEYAFPLLLILSAGELLPMSQWITYSMILGKGRHRLLALASLLEIAVSVGGALLLTTEGAGLFGICLAMAIPAALARGICPLVLGCRLVGVAPASYLARAVLPSLTTAAGPVLLLGLATAWWTPSTWPEIFLFGITYTILYLGVAGIGLFGVEVWRSLAQRITGWHREAEHTPAKSLPALTTTEIYREARS
jgi:O-antigen/teichoic acid export membrane protein